MILNEYQSLIREHFDISDKKTRKTIIALEDAQQNQLLAALASSLYDKITANVDKIDFGTIPKSRGDIEKVDGFENTQECLNIIRSLVVEYKEKTDIVDTVITAVNNVKSLKPLFVKGFGLGSDFLMTFYNLIVLAIEQSVSFLISVTIQFVKDPSSQSMSMALDKAAYNNAKDNMLYEQLYSFNKSFATGELETTLRDILKNNVKLTEDVDSAATLVANDAPEVEAKPEVEFDAEELVKALNANGYEIVKRQEEVEVEEPTADQAPCPGSECPDTNDESEPTPTMPVNGNANPDSQEAVDEFIATGAIVGTLASLGVGAKIGLGIAGAAGVLALGLKGIKYIIKVLIPTIRNITYYIINTAVSISDALAVQAQLIEINAYKLQYSTDSNLDEDEKKKVVDKQLKIAAKLKALSSKFAINDKKAKKEAEKMVEEEKKKAKIDDLKDQLPEDIVAAGDLF